ncbi:MAG: bifunctional ADP-dependent NAD(P)H-hydrate dehydratase/NAD(P)H-hydrate epimerase, partial [Arachnia sp.]
AVAAVAALAEASLVIDAVLGIGGRAGLAGPVALFAASCADLEVPVLAVDLPSGLDCDARTEGASFQATQSITFGALKPCHVIQPFAQRCGRVAVADIGIPVGSTELTAAAPSDIARAWPEPEIMSDKYSRGVVGIDAGSATYPGAGVLACAGAVGAGAGMVRYLGAAPSALIMQRFPSVVLGEGRVQSLLLGPGWAADPDARDKILAAAQRDVPLVIDADALRALPDALGPDPLLTPHAGELARLLGCERAAITQDPVGAARQAAVRYRATVLLKGATQVVATPCGQATLAVPGPAWTAQAGSGDVLAGVCAALLAAGLSAQQAGIMGASIQAMTAAANPGPRPPDVIAAAMADQVARLIGLAAEHAVAQVAVGVEPRQDREHG